MSEKMYCDPAEILEVTVQKGIAKASTSVWKLLCLGFLAGVFIAFASEGSNMAAFGLFAKPETYGLGKFLFHLVPHLYQQTLNQASLHFLLQQVLSRYLLNTESHHLQ